MKIFSEIATRIAHKRQWDQEQLHNNRDAVATAQKKINFILENGVEDQHRRCWILIKEAEEITNAIYMMPIGTPESEWADEQDRIVQALDNLVTEVAIESGKVFQ